MPTFLHTADVHLDSALSANFNSRDAEIRRSELLRSFGRIIDRAKSVDLLLIAGDLFDSKKVSAETVSFIKRKFAELTDTKVFIAAGNHDPFSHDSVYASESFGDNVHVFSTETECVEIPELKTRIYGCSFSGAVCENTIKFPEIIKSDGVTDIILVHADVVPTGGTSIYNPIDRSFISECGADYLALGHIHKRSMPERVGNTIYAYPGIPEGRGFDECGELGCYIGSIKDGVTDVKFEKTCMRQMIRKDIDISDTEDSIHLTDKIAAEIAKAGTENDLYRITLTGRIGFENVPTDLLEGYLDGAAYHIEIYDAARRNYNLDELAAQNNLCGEYVRFMRKRLEAADDSQKELIEDALTLGIEVLLGGDA